MASLHPAFGLGGTLIGAFFWGWVADKIGRSRVHLDHRPVRGHVLPERVLMELLAGGRVVLPHGRRRGWGNPTGVHPDLGVHARPPAGPHRGSPACWPSPAATPSPPGAAYLFLPLEGQRILGHTLGWRTIFLVGVVPSILIAIVRRYIPESPRWLIAHGRVQEALRVVEGLERQAGIRPATRPTLV